MDCKAVTLFVPISIAGVVICSCSPSTPPPEYLQQKSSQHSRQELSAFSTNGPEGGTIHGLARLSDGTYFAGTRRGLFQSTNGGEHWERLTLPRMDSGDEQLLVMDTREREQEVDVIGGDGNLLVAKWSMASDAFMSTNKGESWTKLVVPDTAGRRPGLVMVSSGWIYVHVQSLTSNIDALYSSRDTGRTWETVDLPGARSRGRRIVGMAKVGQGLVLSTSQGLFRRDSGDDRWQRLPSPDSSSIWGVSGKDGSLYLFTRFSPSPPRAFVSHDRGSSWQRFALPEHAGEIYGFHGSGNTTIAATDVGVYRTQNLADWRVSSSGLRLYNVRRLFAIGSTHYAEVAENAYTNSSTVFRTGDLGRSWKLVYRPSPFFHDRVRYAYRLTRITAGGERLFLIDQNRIQVSNDLGTSWHPLATLAAPAPDHSLSLDQVLATENYLLVRAQIEQRASAVRSSDRRWYRVSLDDREVAQVDSGLVSDGAFAVYDDKIFAASGDGVFQFSPATHQWVRVSSPLPGTPNLLRIVNSRIVVGIQSTTSDFRVVTLLYTAAVGNIADPWTRLSSDGLTGVLNDLWVDPDYARVMIAGTDEGLFWTRDGGQHFVRQSKGSTDSAHTTVFALDRSTPHLLAGTDAGVYYLDDRIPRQAWYGRVLLTLQQNRRLSLTLVLGLAMMVVFSTRLILLLLQVDVQPIKMIAPWFYLTRVGRWKLYSGYRRGIAGERETRDLAARYVELPYRSDLRQDGEAQELSATLTGFFGHRAVALIAEGGRGKSTVCRYLLLRLANGEATVRGRRVEPVLVEGLAYTGNLLETITASLTRRRAYVNATIVESQLVSGNVLILFDGFSEIREAVLKGGGDDDISLFVQRYPDVQFVFTSRTPLPANLCAALPEMVTVTLLDVDAETEKIFLGRYLRPPTNPANATAKVEDLVAQIRLRYPGLPRIPLMLKLIADVYDRTGRVPENRLRLFADYTEQLLRPEVTGISDSIGLKVAIRHLARRTFLASGGDRGMMVVRGVQLLEEIRQHLGSFDIHLSPLQVLNLLVRAGLYHRTGEHLRYFHDSFEDYFASQALEEDFHNRDYALIRQSESDERVRDAWGFFLDMLLETGSVQRWQEKLAADAAVADAVHGRTRKRRTPWMGSALFSASLCEPSAAPAHLPDRDHRQAARSRDGEHQSQRQQHQPQRGDGDGGAPQGQCQQAHGKERKGVKEGDSPDRRRARCAGGAPGPGQEPLQSFSVVHRTGCNAGARSMAPVCTRGPAG